MKSIADIAKEYFPEAKPCHCGGAHEICLNCQICRADEADELYDPEKGIAHYVDATVLKADTRTQDIIALCQVAKEYQTASVCINPCFLPIAKAELAAEVPLCTVINFPLGAGQRQSIIEAARAAISTGANEVDMVQAIAFVRDRQIAEALEIVSNVALMCHQTHTLLKVIIETCYLDYEEKVLSCLISKKAGAKYVKTSTGFGSAGASAEDIELMRRVVGPKLGVKASGGIRDKDTAEKMLLSGASRIGASSVKALI